jgi:adenylate cyclase
MKYAVLTEVLLAFGIAVILLGCVSFLVAKNMREPLTRIIDATAAISRGELKTRIEIQRNDELGVMGGYINLMAEQLQEREFIRETFGRYVSEDVAKTLLTQDTKQTLGGEERVVTILFCDMRGYSTISEQMPPQQIVEMLNHYLSTMTEIINKHEGCIIEFMGDAIFAVFGAPHYLTDHAEKSVRCAIEMRSRLTSLNNELKESGITRYWKSDTITKLSIRIGIHTGHVVAGNLGSRTRMKYSIIGDTVNVAARLEVLNKELDTDILISRDVYSQLPEELSSEMVNYGEHVVKGREQPVTVYSVETLKQKPKLSVLTQI